jgi:hypothetical protein
MDRMRSECPRDTDDETDASLQDVSGTHARDDPFYHDFPAAIKCAICSM